MSPPTLGTLVYPLVIPQGADWPGVDFPIVGPDGQPYDLTGCTALGQIRPLPRSGELYFEWSTEPTGSQGTITLNVERSTLNIRVLASESDRWTFKDAVYDVVLTDPSAPVGFKVSRVVKGSVKVDLEVTT